MSDTSPPNTSEPDRLRRTLIDLTRVALGCDREAACCEGVSASGSHALEALARLGPATLGDVAAELFVDKSTASRVIRSLETDGLIARAPDPQDRRAVRLSLTRVGDEVLGRIRAQGLETNARILERYPPEVRRGMVDLLADLVAETARTAGATRATCCTPPPQSGPVPFTGEAGEREAVRRLVTEAGLSDSGPGTDFPAGWMLMHAPSGVGLAATACIERHADDALLRSVAVRQGWQGRGVGRQVVESALAAAGAEGIQRIYLLTTDAADFFARLGFTPVDRSEVPDAVREAESFAQPRCANARAMVKRLNA